jgi:hypothetical protein
VGALDPRVRRLVSDQRQAPVAAPDPDAPRSRQPRRRALRRGGRLAAGGDHRAGRSRRMAVLYELLAGAREPRPVASMAGSRAA